jgi:predicted ATP-grasp superfamily ATP-dependent carboligase
MWGREFVSFLLRVGDQYQLNGWVLLPMQDDVVEVVARSHPALSGVYRLVTQDWETIRWAHDKRLAYRVAEELGIAYPRSWYPVDADDLGRMDITYPAIVKPATSIRLQYAIGRKALPARTPAELLEQYALATTIDDPDLLMVQEVIPGDGRAQYSVASFCKDGRVLAAMTARRTRQYPLDYGRSSTFVEAVEVPGLIDVAVRLLARLGLSGMVEVEFKHDSRDGVNKLLDINPRPWAWHTLCIACGLDFPYMQYRAALGLPVEPVSPRYGYRWRRLITDVPATVQQIRGQMTNPVRPIRSRPGKVVPSVLDLGDPIPVLGDLAVALWRTINAGAMVGRRLPESEGQRGRDG